MGTNIERRFLPASTQTGIRFFRQFKTSPKLIRQGYLAIDRDHKFFVRTVDDVATKYAWQCFRGPETSRGKAEFEQEISLHTAHEMLQLSRGREVTKSRFCLPYDDVTLRVDAFREKLEPLIIIKVELAVPNQEPALPEWVGDEITERREYSNSALACHGLPHHFDWWKRHQS